MGQMTVELCSQDTAKFDNEFKVSCADMTPACSVCGLLEQRTRSITSRVEAGAMCVCVCM